MEEKFRNHKGFCARAVILPHRTAPHRTAARERELHRVTELGLAANYDSPASKPATSVAGAVYLAF